MIVGVEFHDATLAVLICCPTDLNIVLIMKNLGITELVSASSERASPTLSAAHQ